MLKIGDMLQMDIRDHRGDPGGREHRRSFSLAFGFSDSIPRTKLERRRDGGVGERKKKIHSFFLHVSVSLIRSQEACTPTEKQLGVTSSFLRLHLVSV